MRRELASKSILDARPISSFGQNCGKHDLSQHARLLPLLGSCGLRETCYGGASWNAAVRVGEDDGVVIFVVEDG